MEPAINFNMPTKLDRVQVLFNKEIFQKLKLIAKLNRRSLSSMVSGIVEDAFKSSKYQSLFSKAKAIDLESKVDEVRVLFEDILKCNLSGELDSDVDLKLKKISEILSLISKTNQYEIESFNNEDILVEDVLEPSVELQTIDEESGKKILKLRQMLSNIKSR